MTLQRKTLLIFGSSFLALLFVFYVVFSWLLRNNVESAQNASASQALRVAKGLLTQTGDRLAEKFADWAAWDDAYDFVRNRNVRFMESNLGNESLALLRIHYILFLDTQGRIVYGTAFDLKSKAKKTVPESLKQLLNNAALRRFDKPDARRFGFAFVDDQLTLLSLYPIVTSELKGPPRGTLVVGRTLDNEELRRLTNESGLSITLRSISESSTLPSAFQDALGALQRRPAEVPLQPLDDKTLGAYALMSNIEGQRNLLLQVALPRNTEQESAQSLRYLFVTLLLSALVLGGATIISLRALVLAPLTRLSDEVRHVRDSGDAAQRIAVSGDRELAVLAHDINAMLARLEETQARVRENEERFRSATQYAAVGVGIVSPDGRFLQANRALCALLGYDESELQSLTFQELTHPDDLRADEQNVQRLLDGQIQSYQMEKRYRHRDGYFVWGLLSVSLVRDKKGAPLYFISQVQDISARKDAEVQLQQAHEELQSRVGELTQRTREMELVGEMGEMLQICRTRDEAGQIIQQGVRTLFPSIAGALSIMNSSQDRVEIMLRWGDGCIADVVKDAYFAPDECWSLRRGRVHRVEDAKGVLCGHVAPEMNGSYLCLPMTAERQTLGVLHLCRNDGQTWNTTQLQLARTVAEQISLALFNLELQATLRHQSVRDPLTGLFNRRHMEESLARELSRAERKAHPISLILFDVDHFKRFNDTFGHEAGDLVLREIGAVLKEKSRKMDIACRYGGEEFLLILPECALENAVKRAEELRAAVKALALRHQEKSLGQITLSLGVVAYPEQGKANDDLIRNADALLYEAKRAGRDRVMAANDTVQQNAPLKLESAAQT
jgi:diguanylate cyclase (GGDEF)-like protein/PAS domain S-box-containing protein